MGLVRAWRRQIYGASLVAILIPAVIIAVLFVATGNGPLTGLGTLGQVFSGPAIPGGNLSARVSLNPKAALPSKGTAAGAALQGHSPVIGQPSGGGSQGPRPSGAAPAAPGTTTSSSSTGQSGQLHSRTGVAGAGNGGTPPPPPTTPTTTPTTTTTTSSTTTDTSTAATQPPIVAVPPPVTTTETTTTTTPTITTTPTTKTTTTTVTHTTTVRLPTTRTITRPLVNATPQIATTVAQAEHGSARFTGCDGDWGVGPTGKVGVTSYRAL